MRPGICLCEDVALGVENTTLSGSASFSVVF
jgi:hypothetical protein